MSQVYKELLIDKIKNNKENSTGENNLRRKKLKKNFWIKKLFRIVTKYKRNYIIYTSKVRNRMIKNLLRLSNKIIKRRNRLIILKKRINLYKSHNKNS